jgi:predicted amidohydrolase
MKISLLQFDIKWMDIQSNIDQISDHLGSLNNEIDLLVLPEMYLTGFNMDAKSASISEDHPAIKTLISLAKKYNTGIIGSLAISEGTTYYNRVLLISDGGIGGRYDKQYLFTPSGESDTFSKKYPTSLIEYKGWKLLPQVCYDLRFPENVRSIDKADLIIYMANWPIGRIQHWNALLKARAIENQCYVIGCNRIGRDDNGWEFPGSSQINAANGISTLIDQNEKSLEIEISIDDVHNYRNKYPYWKDKK